MEKNLTFFTHIYADVIQVKASPEEGKDVRLGDWKAANVEILNTFQLLTAKPIVYLVRSS